MARVLRLEFLSIYPSILHSQLQDLDRPPVSPLLTVNRMRYRVRNSISGRIGSAPAVGAEVNAGSVTKGKGSEHGAGLKERFKCFDIGFYHSGLSGQSGTGA